MSNYLTFPRCTFLRAKRPRHIILSGRSSIAALSRPSLLALLVREGDVVGPDVELEHLLANDAAEHRPRVNTCTQHNVQGVQEELCSSIFTKTTHLLSLEEAAMLAIDLKLTSRPILSGHFLKDQQQRWDAL